MANLTPKRLSEIEEQLMNLQHELQQYISVDGSVQQVTNQYQNDAVTFINKARVEVTAIVHNLNNYPKVN